MSEAFEILSAALDEAIADAQSPILKRQLVTLDKEKINPSKFKPRRNTMGRFYMRNRAALLRKTN